MGAQSAAQQVFQPLHQVIEPLTPLWAVGGAVRAALQHQPLTGIDVDLATPVPIHTVAALLHDLNLPIDTKGLRWGSLMFTLDGKPYDITQFRSETYTSSSRYPNVHLTNDQQVDAARRDFTFNAIYMNPHGFIFDPYHGQADLAAGIVRFIGNPATRLAEDPLRALRFLRFCALYGPVGFTSEILELFNKNLQFIQKLPKLRIHKELVRFAHQPHTEEVEKMIHSTPLGVWVNAMLQK